jgi:putative two-component system response regulator
MIVQDQLTTGQESDGALATPDGFLHRRTIMIVDDVAVNVKVVQAHLTAAGFQDFVTVTDPTQAVSTLRHCRPDVLLLDIMMPGISGLDILKTIREDAEFGLMPVLILTGAESPELKRKALQFGATDFLAKPVDAEELVPRVRNALLVKSHQDELEARVKIRTAELEKVRQELIYCLARASEYRDNETGNHVVRVGCFAQIIGEQLGLDPVRVEMLRQAATLHDLGKIGVPDSVLLKPGKLTPEEFELMKKHAGFGKKICQPMSIDEMGTFTSHTTVGANIMSGCTSPVLAMAALIALTHHERWDGSGYPLGLSGEDIPLEGRITAVADVFDALCSKRPYKPAFPLDKCFGILEENRGTHFDPSVLDAFLARRDDIVSTQIAYADVD